MHMDLIALAPAIALMSSSGPSSRHDEGGVGSIVDCHEPRNVILLVQHGTLKGRMKRATTSR